MTQHQIEIPADIWEKWKRKVPQNLEPDERVRQLMEADIKGRVRGRGGDRWREIPGDYLDAVDFPDGRDYRDCADAVYQARDYVLEQDGATDQELMENVMPEWPAGYDTADTELGEGYRAWWARVVKPGLESLPSIQAPAEGENRWEPADKNPNL